MREAKAKPQRRRGGSSDEASSSTSPHPRLPPRFAPDKGGSALSPQAGRGDAARVAAVTAAPRILGLILAGGLGRRMGGVDKPLLPLGGEPILARIATRLHPQCPAGLVLSANGDPGRFKDIFDGPVLPDSLPGLPGPLAGILAGLEYAAGLPGVTQVLSVPGDAPFLPEDLVARLAASPGPIAVAASGGREHYTAALWPIALRDDLRAWLAAGERRVGGFIARHGSSVVEWPVEPVDPFLNLNAPEDFACAEGIVRSRSSS